jgi:hypothetical protein
MKIYAVRAKGVYYKDISGLFTSKDEAEIACNTMASKDVDSYHEWVVTEHNLGDLLGVGEMYLDVLASAVYHTDKSARELQQ